MAILELVPKSEEKQELEVQEVLEWLDRTKENVKTSRVTNIAIAWVTEDNQPGSGWIAYDPMALFGAIEIMKQELYNSCS